MTPTTSPHPTVAKFQRHVELAEGVYRRRDSGSNTGRNSTASDRTLATHVEEARALLVSAVLDASNPLPEWLDANERFAARWNRVERRFYGATA